MKTTTPKMSDNTGCSDITSQMFLKQVAIGIAIAASLIVLIQPAFWLSYHQ
jgi:hypothetical protein